MSKTIYGHSVGVVSLIYDTYATQMREVHKKVLEPRWRTFV